MDMNEKITKVIAKCSELVKRSERVHKDVDDIKSKAYCLNYELERGSAIENDTMNDILSSIYDIIRCVEAINHAAKRISELAKLGKCDRYMAARIKMAVCEITAAEKQIEVLKEMLDMK